MLKCPVNKPLQDKDGYCHSCDTPSPIKTEDCNKCEDRYDAGAGICRFCEGTVSKDGKSCIER